ncbi:hypothetical protein NVS55_16980 [Myxococcus stipitatus]|nr:hypothetical protein [Myxococcus landrumus]
MMNPSASVCWISNGLAIATFSRRPSCANGKARCFSASAIGNNVSVASVTASKSASCATG